MGLKLSPSTQYGHGMTSAIRDGESLLIKNALTLAVPQADLKSGVREPLLDAMLVPIPNNCKLALAQ